MSSDYGDEDDFMNNLLADMDESLLRTPVKSVLPSNIVRPSNKPIERPKFPKAGSNSTPKPSTTRELAMPAVTPVSKPSVVFTPAKLGTKDTVLTTRISGGKRVLSDDNIEGSYPPLPEEVCNFMLLDILIALTAFTAIAQTRHRQNTSTA
jgi:hypothetical protein